jgi:cytidine deaminase
MTTNELSQEAIQQLLRAARDARERAYVPYSHYPVGAALLGSNGIIYTGCNVENAAFPATICAERTALVKAVSEGQQEFVAVAVVTGNGGSPCGLCRQMLYEFAPELRVITADMNLNVIIDDHMDHMLLHGFGPKSLRP